ncbi:MAG: diphthine synthase [Desulfurococcaceae archaeon]
MHLMLVFIGLGYSLRHLTLEAVEELKTADVIYVDTYTSLYEDPIEELRSINPKAEYIYVKRKDLEGPAIRRVVNEALRRKIIIAVPGDPFIATTHDAILSEAIKYKVPYKIINGISVFTMVYGRVGLQSYRFGKPVTLVYPTHFKPYSTIEVIYDNLGRRLHTLVLLDLRVDESKAMSIPEAVDIILELDEKKLLRNNLAIGLARLGWRDEKICADTLERLKNHSYPPPPHSLVITGGLDPVEEEFIEHWRTTC